MKLEEIAIRQEIRQMLNEAGLNKVTIKEIVKEEIRDQVKRQIKQALAETNLKDYVEKVAHTASRAEISSIVSRILNDMFCNKKIQVKFNLE